MVGWTTLEPSDIHSQVKQHKWTLMATNLCHVLSIDPIALVVAVVVGGRKVKATAVFAAWCQSGGPGRDLAGESKSR